MAPPVIALNSDGVDDERRESMERMLTPSALGNKIVLDMCASVAIAFSSTTASAPPGSLIIRWDEGADDRSTIIRNERAHSRDGDGQNE